jgi:hypothetical protein
MRIRTPTRKKPLEKFVVHIVINIEVFAGGLQTGRLTNWEDYKRGVYNQFILHALSTHAQKIYRENGSQEKKWRKYQEWETRSSSHTVM